MSDKRYFHVNYMFKGGIGCKSIISTGMFNKNQQESEIERESGVKNAGILSWVEMSKDDFWVFAQRSVE